MKAIIQLSEYGRVKPADLKRALHRFSIDVRGQGVVEGSRRGMGGSQAWDIKGQEGVNGSEGRGRKWSQVEKVKQRV